MCYWIWIKINFFVDFMLFLNVIEEIGIKRELIMLFVMSGKC